MKLTTDELNRAKRLSTQSPNHTPTNCAYTRRARFLMSLNGGKTIKEMVTLLYDALGDQVTNTNLYAFCDSRGIPYARERAPRRTKRGKGIDIHDHTSNGQDKVEYTTLNRNDYERYK